MDTCTVIQTASKSSHLGKPARLVLEDGCVYHGESIGALGTAFGEIVFNTSATGYQEILTDPSYQGQMVLMTHPEIGNYGVNSDDFESGSIHAFGFIVSRLSPFTSSWRAEATVQDFLSKNNVVGIEGVDTRSITRKIRKQGAMKAAITTEPLSILSEADLLAQVQAIPNFSEEDFISQVTTEKPYTLDFLAGPRQEPLLEHLGVLDFGIKKSILTYLRELTRTVTVFPANTDFETLMATNPQGVLLSNGPGDPTVLKEAVETARRLVESGMPTFGICLGHQILGLACGAKIEKMRFGHHGGNHPVKDMASQQILITSQNHGYEVAFDDFPADELVITHINLNDGSIEGFCHRHAPVMSVQFHPEASPGPHDANDIFERFAETAMIGKCP